MHDHVPVERALGDEAFGTDIALVGGFTVMSFQMVLEAICEFKLLLAYLAFERSLPGMSLHMNGQVGLFAKSLVTLDTRMRFFV
jgi:hypothetical protein